MRLPFNLQPKRTELQEHALKKALSTYNSDPEKYKHTMFCPYCGSPLVKSGEQRRFETLSEHVSDPNGTVSLKDEYICSAEGIFESQYLYEGEPDARVGCEFGILHSWNGNYEEGESYSSDYRSHLYELSDESIINKRVIYAWFNEDRQHKHKAALNTLNCNCQTSIYKEGLRREICFPAWITFNIIRLRLEFDYSADNFGRVTGTFVRLGFLKYDKNNNDYLILGTWPWETWRFLNNKTKKGLKRAKNIKDEDKKLKEIAKAMNISGNDDWVYRLHQWYEYVIHPKYAKMLKKAGYYKKSSWRID